MRPAFAVLTRRGRGSGIADRGRAASPAAPSRECGGACLAATRAQMTSGPTPLRAGGSGARRLRQRRGKPWCWVETCPCACWPRGGAARTVRLQRMQPRSAPGTSRRTWTIQTATLAAVLTALLTPGPAVTARLRAWPASGARPAWSSPRLRRCQTPSPPGVSAPPRLPPPPRRPAWSSLLWACQRASPRRLAPRMWRRRAPPVRLTSTSTRRTVTQARRRRG
mmetsp:Transcript_6185/g.25770  ORF Transcript_6185/g.25770 Transcript_6185/m.25770 type:complete len:223 (-) Transcript_6185:209-877(-)